MKYLLSALILLAMAGGVRGQQPYVHNGPVPLDKWAGEPFDEQVKILQDRLRVLEKKVKELEDAECYWRGMQVECFPDKDGILLFRKKK